MKDEKQAEKYPGTPPGWKPDEVLAFRGFDSVSIDQQAKDAASAWAADPANPAYTAPDPAAIEVKDSEV